jgi:hypothetical protein
MSILQSLVRPLPSSARGVWAVCPTALSTARPVRSSSANCTSTCTSTSSSCSYIANSSAVPQRSRSSIVACSSASSETVLQPPSPPTSSNKDTPIGAVWEIDFCSRPLLDERGKKVWELLICDPERNFEYAEYFANSKINSAEVRLTCSGHIL